VGPEQLGKAFRKARDAAGLHRVRLHDLRHAVATMLVDAGTNARVVSDVMGHSTISFTLMSYFHPDETQAQAAMDTVERLLGGVERNG
jgi:integrase